MTPLDLAVRPALPDDAAPLAAFAERVFRATFSPHNAADDMDAYCSAAFSLDQQLRELTDHQRYTALAIARGELAGYAQLYSTPPPPCVTGPEPIELKRIYVDPRWHGGGLAHTLMVHAVEVARQRGAQTLYLAVWQHNHRAIAFYARYGFVTVGSAEFRLGRDLQIDPIMMVPLRSIRTSATG